MTILPPDLRPANPTRTAQVRTLPAHIRTAITAELAMLFNRVDLLVARLDAADLDPDLEEDDPCGDPLDLRGETADDEGRGVLPTRPVYGIDQTAGPINYVEAQRAFIADENGLVRSERGGWRRAA